MNLKTILKHILPLTIGIFDKRVRKLEKNHKFTENFGKIVSGNKTVQVEINKCYKSIQELKKHHTDDQMDFKNLSEKINKLELRVQLNDERAIEIGKFYNSQYEYKVIESFHEAYDRKDYRERFLKLIENLEEEDVKRIVCILQRQQMVRKNPQKEIDLYTREEQRQINDMRKYIMNHVFRIDDSLFCYDQYLLPVKHFEPSVFYYKHGIDDLHSTSVKRIKGKDIIDVGGFYGDSVLVLEELQPRSVYTFEGIEQNFELLTETIRLNKIENCIAEHLALGAYTGEVVFDIKGSQSNMQTLNYLEDTKGQEQVKITTLDRYVENKQLEIGLIKVDIEGAEQQFLEGARKTIEEHKPVLLLSIYHTADDFFGIKPIIESWNLGYTFKIHKPCDYTISREVLLLCEILD